MRSFKLLLLSAAFLAACETVPKSVNSAEVSSATQLASERGPLINRTEVVAVVSSQDVATDLEQKAAHWGYALKRKEALNELGLFVLTFDCPPGIDPHVASLELEQLSPKSTVGANHRYTLQVSDRMPPPSTSLISTASPRIYANALIEWPEDGCRNFTSIGMIDGGISANAKILKSASINSRSFVENISNEATEHGTAIAEILVGPGRLNGGSLYSAAVVGTDEDGNVYSGVEPILKALNWMVKSDVHIVNISLAGPYNRALRRGIDRATNKGVIIVAAVGNLGPDAGPQFPAALPSVIAATAVDENGLIYLNAVQGPHVDVAAPGVNVWVGEQGRYLTGTSVAAPFVAAMIAADRDLSSISDSEKLREKLFSGSLDLGDVGPDSVYGAGLLQTNKSCRA